MPLPYELRQEFVKGNLVLFVGAGFTKNFLPAMPSWEELLRKTFARLTGNQDEIFNFTQPVLDPDGTKRVAPAEYLRLAQIFELVREQRNRGTLLDTFIPSIHTIIQDEIWATYDQDRAREAVRGHSIQNCCNLPLFTWLTTNFDTFIEDALLHDHIRSGTGSVMARPVYTRDFRNLDSQRTLFKIHGCVNTRPAETSIVITEDDYTRFGRQDKYFTHKLFVLFCEKTVVFLGYSLADPNIRSIYNDVLFDQKGAGEGIDAIRSFSHLRPAFFVSRNPVDEPSKAYYRHKRIEYIVCSIEDFFAELTTVYEEHARRISDVKAHVTASKVEFEQLLRDLIACEWSGTLPWDPLNGLGRVERLFDILELYEGNSRTGSCEPFEVPFNTFVGAVHAAIRTLKSWNVVLLDESETAITEAVLERLEKKFKDRSSMCCRDLFALVEDGILAHRNLDLGIYARRYTDMIFDYDDNYRSWDDYVYSLDRYIMLSVVYEALNVQMQRQYIDRLYGQIRLCGRSRGESWYSVNKLYEKWAQFSLGCWPALRARIERAGISIQGETVYPGHEQDMLDHLQPGADVRSFLPR